MVDDHALFRQGVASILRGQKDLVRVGEPQNGSSAVTAAVEMVDRHSPGKGLSFSRAAELHKRLLTRFLPLQKNSVVALLRAT